MSTRIVVPCFNEATRFDAGAFDDYLANAADVDFVFVNDGSTDATHDVLRGVERRWPSRVAVVDLQPNQGKAAAVRAGMIEALSAPVRYVGYFDADLATPLEAIAELVEILERDPAIDVVMGARVALLGRQISRDPFRHYSGRAFASAASAVLGLPVYDTQCGAKLFRVSPLVSGLFQAPFGSRWIFDVEILARFLVAGGRPEAIHELPLRRWTDVGESHVKARDFLRSGAELLAIARRYRLPRQRGGLRAAFRRGDKS